ncbi:MAG: HNH endonuclease [Gracilimonas sp.]|uniref:HNH endonuclease n=1 Tax=Gracilimonas sp. TaxID=1974203 RepID=UPI001B21B500|nr:HNH endonuclease [Gracilimonas sp.]MBO6586652.1 HNH endonuclease [Gracilimonas sp.]MBO6615309.1 HNH endonuclease [Gracilimonas sp.]
MKVTEQHSQKAYEVSKAVYLEEISFQDGRSLLKEKHEMNPNTASDFINIFKCMMEGKRFTRTLNAYSTNYFLENIKQDFGIESLIDALTSLKLHIEYYESLRNTTLRTVRKIYDQFSGYSLLSIDNAEQDEIHDYLTSNNVDRDLIIEELNSISSSDPQTITIKSTSYKRDNKTIAQLKYLRDYKCQICGHSIQKRDNTFYIEAAHIIPKNQKGPESPRNILILCPNHHKEFDVSDRKILKHTSKRIVFSMNGKEYEISLELK